MDRYPNRRMQARDLDTNTSIARNTGAMDSGETLARQE